MTFELALPYGVNEMSLTFNEQEKPPSSVIGLLTTPGDHVQDTSTSGDKTDTASLSVGGSTVGQTGTQADPPGNAKAAPSDPTIERLPSPRSQEVEELGRKKSTRKSTHETSTQTETIRTPKYDFSTRGLSEKEDQLQTGPAPTSKQYELAREMIQYMHFGGVINGCWPNPFESWNLRKKQLLPYTFEDFYIMIQLVENQRDRLKNYLKSQPYPKDFASAINML